MISKPDSLNSELQDECYFSYSHASSNQNRLRRTQRSRPSHPLKPSDQPPQTAVNNIPDGSSSALHPSICSAPSAQLPAPSPPQSRSPPDCACPRLFKVQEPLTPALTVAPTPIYGPTVVGAQPGHQISPETSQNRDVTNAAPCIFPPKSTHHAPCPHALRRQHPPASLNVRALEVLRIACKHIPPRIVPAPPPLSARLRAKWATIQAAEALVQEIDDSSRQAESCTKLPRRKRTIRRPGPAPEASTVQAAPPAQDTLLPAQDGLPAQDALPAQDVLPTQEVAPV
ncbi:hypothetical protein CROQUDRAFT_653639 [Cronartium quercuum f. sp. fusiforme G11]|uniref:Uncharacterized protein n=1 Tax=Cronartium quercuum f. sp. fusiforme G11 TaxID=708437 RepID=A0A9P6NTS9_9BASI|nr:hypothetical protein CROQUDRAFT_653639 [Cronartium quercuum f. sp. fusiforme G11]